MFGLDSIKSWVLAKFLKDSVAEGSTLPPPNRRAKEPEIPNPPVFIDHYKENFTSEDWEIDRKVHQAVANVKAGLKSND